MENSAKNTNSTDNCQINPERLQSLAECLETYGIERDNPDEKNWPHNVLSTQTVVYDCGACCQSSDTIPHYHDPTEFQLCQDLAAQAAEMMQGIYIGMGDENDHELAPFYVVANQDRPSPTSITEQEIRSAFGGTIYPQARIEICPLQAGSGQWWEYLSDPEYTAPEIMAAWQKLIDWYQTQKDLSNSVFVEINLDTADGHENNGCVMPRLVVGLTKAGSLVGLSSCVVHT
jgi:hypothetical protein